MWKWTLSKFVVAELVVVKSRGVVRRCCRGLLASVVQLVVKASEIAVGLACGG